MILTNRYDLPRAFAEAVGRNQRTPQPRTISVTELIKPPQVLALERLHHAELEADVSDFLPQFFGSAVHHWLDRHGDGAFREQTLRIELDGWTVHGTPDHLEWLAIGDGAIIDWKTTLVRSLAYERAEHEPQVNLYAHLARRCGLPPVTSATIWLFLRDWDAVQMVSDPAYPRAGIVRRDVRLWPPEQAELYLWERLNLHRAAQEDGAVPECSDEERWKRHRWAVVKKGNGRATRVFDTKDEARQYADAATPELAHWPDWFDVERRDGKPLRCMKFCAAAPWCPQWAREREAMSLPELMEVT